MLFYLEYRLLGQKLVYISGIEDKYRLSYKQSDEIKM